MPAAAECDTGQLSRPCGREGVGDGVRNFGRAGEHLGKRLEEPGIGARREGGQSGQGW